MAVREMGAFETRIDKRCETRSNSTLPKYLPNCNGIRTQPIPNHSLTISLFWVRFASSGIQATTRLRLKWQEINEKTTPRSRQSRKCWKLRSRSCAGRVRQGASSRQVLCRCESISNAKERYMPPRGIPKRGSKNTSIPSRNKIAAHEARMGHSSIADKVSRLVDKSKVNKAKLKPLNPEPWDRVLEVEPEARLNELIAAPAIKDRISRSIHEYVKCDKLRRVRFAERCCMAESKNLESEPDRITAIAFSN